ncbi:MAG: hypothetical protein WDW36_000488 [Sanguina aurantia]
MGRGLFARVEIEPGEVIISVPWSNVFASQALQKQLEALGCDKRDFMWAVQLLLSRCFYYGPESRHLAVPGIDMCNHSHAPSAAVKVLHSPDSCQGREANEDIAPPLPPSSTSDTLFQLVAGEDGISAGQEVTISYGPWPAQPFFLLFGFVPGCNPYESVSLFTDLDHMAGRYVHYLEQTQGRRHDIGGLLDQLSRTASGKEDAGEPEHLDFPDLLLYAHGWEPRMQQAFSLVQTWASACTPSALAPAPPLPRSGNTPSLAGSGEQEGTGGLGIGGRGLQHFVAWELKGRLQRLGQSSGEGAVGGDTTGASLAGLERLCVQYRESKQAVLRDAVLALTGPA